MHCTVEAKKAEAGIESGSFGESVNRNTGLITDKPE